MSLGPIPNSSEEPTATFLQSLSQGFWDVPSLTMPLSKEHAE